MIAITKQDLINYLHKSPENLNFNIFNKMLDDYKKTYEIDDEIKQAIENLYEKMIGEPATDQESISGIINELADNYTAPETDLSDYYTKEETDAAIASGGIFTFNCTFRENEDRTVMVDNVTATYEEIVNALDNGKVVILIAKYTVDSKPFVFFATDITKWAPSGGIITFDCIRWSTGINNLATGWYMQYVRRPNGSEVWSGEARKLEGAE